MIESSEESESTKLFWQNGTVNYQGNIHAGEGERKERLEIIYD
jgi:hypothetical protein